MVSWSASFSCTNFDTTLTAINFPRIVKKRCYSSEKEELQVSKIETDIHPLMTASGKNETGTKINSTPVRKRLPSNYSDPLLGFALEGCDPLSQRAEECLDFEQHNTQVLDQPGDKIFHKWLQQRTAIFNKFTTTEKLSITSSFLQGGEKCNSIHSNINMYKF